MRWFIFRLIDEFLAATFKPCPRDKAGYSCKRYQPGGCKDCGRRR